MTADDIRSAIKKEAQKQWKLENKEWVRKYNKEYKKRYYRENPWAKTFLHINSRCNYPKHHYFKKNIKNYLTLAQTKILWFRDKAYCMKNPSIDRIDNSGDYTFDNCQYIEMKENSKKDRGWRKFGQCKECKTTELPHWGKGLCRRCYQREYMRHWKPSLREVQSIIGEVK